MVRPINNQSADESLIMSFSHDDDDDEVEKEGDEEDEEDEDDLNRKGLPFCDPLPVNPHNQINHPKSFDMKLSFGKNSTLLSFL